LVKRVEELIHIEGSNHFRRNLAGELISLLNLVEQMQSHLEHSSGEDLVLAGIHHLLHLAADIFTELSLLE
jgi:hypothetical protein